MSSAEQHRTVSEHDRCGAAVRCCSEQLRQRRLVRHLLGRDRQPQGGELDLSLPLACVNLGGRLTCAAGTSWSRAGAREGVGELCLDQRT